MSVFNDDFNNIYHTSGSRVVWSTTSRPVLLLPSARVTIPSIDISWPHFATANIYGYSQATVGGFDSYAASSYISVVPQEWDSGLSLVANLPSGANYFQVDLNFSRIVAPQQWLQTTIPTMLAQGQWQTLDGASAIAERIGPMVRMFSFERSGNSVYLRRKQSVINAGEQVAWLSGNNPVGGGGAQRSGWTWGGTLGNLGHAASLRDQRFTSFSNRGQSNMAAIDDNTNFSSTWRAAIVITPGYIKA